MLCYVTFIDELLGNLIKAFRVWPTVLDSVRHVPRPAQPGIEGVGIPGFFVMPVLESLFLVGIVQVLAFLRVNSFIQAAVPALLFSILHALQFPIWGVMVFPFFILDAATFIYWRNASAWLAAAMAILLHLLTNAVPTIHILLAHVRS